MYYMASRGLTYPTRLARAQANSRQPCSPCPSARHPSTHIRLYRAPSRICLVRPRCESFCSSWEMAIGRCHTRVPKPCLGCRLRAGAGRACRIRPWLKLGTVRSPTYSRQYRHQAPWLQSAPCLVPGFCMSVERCSSRPWFSGHRCTLDCSTAHPDQPDRSASHLRNPRLLLSRRRNPVFTSS